MRRKIAIAITFAVGLYYFLEFVLPASVGGGFDCRRMGSPCLVATDDGTRLYYTGVHALKKSTDERLAIGLAESRDGKAWHKADGNPLVRRSLFSSKDWGGPDNPAVVREPDGTYTMFYVGHGAGGTDRIMRSTSADGRRWRGRRVVFSLVEKAAEAKGEIDRLAISALAVLRTDAGYVAYFASTYRRGERIIEGVSRATSADGLEWTLDEANNPVLAIEPENGWTYTTITDLSIVESDDGLRLYYGGTKTYFLNNGQLVVPVTLIGLATSDDGIAWTRHPGNPVFGPAMFERGLDAYTTWVLAAEPKVAAPERFDATVLSGLSVARTAAGGYVLAYTGILALGAKDFKIGIATSDDGIAWQRGEAPVLELGSEPQNTYLTTSLTTTMQVFLVVGAMALGLGLFSLVRLHGGRIIKGDKDSVYSVGFFVALGVTLVLAFVWGEGEGKLLRPGHKLYNIIFHGLMESFGASSMGLLTFYLASASYRSFKLKNAEAGLMMVAAILVMLGQVPLGQILTAWLPPPVQIQNVAYWISYTIMVPTMRAIQIGAAVGGLVLAMRLWLSMDKRRL